MQRTLVLLKPDAVQRGLAGEIISRLERRGLRFVAMKLMRVSNELAQKHYAEHVGKPFFDGLVSFITSSPIVAMVVEGEGVVEIVRTTMGATKASEAAPGTIRGDLAV
ncbi:MAG: nucleoside-diphosphate kinase, partial [Chloroflexi bacterium]|nr:nucleoside-diphosphate kinase [Chloroflexota bacterium]